tara:strand:- start:2311 stop:2829 length:519 start_codon:yes stop_codon:yes gene_type:complete
MPENDKKGKVTLKDLLHTVKVDDKKADKVDIKIGAENDLAIEKDKKGDDVYAGGLKEKFLKIGGKINEAPVQTSKVDFSNWRGYSNADQKWKKTEHLNADVNEWIATVAPGLTDSALKELGMALQGLGKKVEMQAKGKEAPRGATAAADRLNRRGSDNASTSISRQSGGLYS